MKWLKGKASLLINVGALRATGPRLGRRHPARLGNGEILRNNFEAFLDKPANITTGYLKDFL